MSGLRRRICVGLGAVLATLLVAGGASAGSGDMREIAGPVTYGLDLEFNFPVLWPDDRDEYEEAVQWASEILCDATEGQVVIDRVTWSVGDGGDPDAQIWPDNRRATVSPSSRGFGSPIGFPWTLNGHTVAHELAHYVFGLLDLYGESPRFGGGCDTGSHLDRGELSEYNGSLMQQGRNPRPPEHGDDLGVGPLR